MNKLKVLLGTKKFFQIFLSALWNLIFNLIFYQIPASEVIEDQNFASEDKTALLWWTDSHYGEKYGGSLKNRK